jgi:hypothetical protein
MYTFIQEHDRRVFKEAPGNGDPLLLPPTQLQTPLTHLGVPFLRKGLNESPGKTGIQRMTNIYINTD